MRKTIIAALTALGMTAVATVAFARTPSSPEIKELQVITARYHSLTKAISDGYKPFSIDPNNPEATCFDDDDGGMGIHYVRNIDEVIDALDPEALVYQVSKNGKPKLVAVEYIIPQGFVDPQNVPMLFGQRFHPHSFLPVYILHAWVWETNPDGMFKDFNPNVSACPNT